MQHVQRIKKYYNRNTRYFLRWGDQQGTLTLHQPLWKEKNFTKKQALHYPHELIQKWINRLRTIRDNSIHIADYGSGVGASIHYLSQQNPEDFFYGITISEVQHALAKERLEDNPQIQCILDDFEKHQPRHPYDLIYHIESYNYVENRFDFLKAISHALRPGGFWIIFDDFLEEGIPVNKTILNYEYGWMLGKLQTVQSLLSDASSLKFELVSNEDLTRYLKLGRTRDQWIRHFAPLIRRLARFSVYFRSWYGGMNRQKSLKHELIKYRMVVLRRVRE